MTQCLGAVSFLVFAVAKVACGLGFYVLLLRNLQKKLIAVLMSSLHDLCQVTELRLSPKLQFLVRYGIISLETKSFTAPVRKLWVVPKFLH